MSKNQQKQAYLYALSAVLFWSTVATAFKLSLRVLDPIQLLFYAAVTSTLVLGTIVVIQGKVLAVFSCTRRQYVKSLGLGLLNPCAYYLVLLQAYDLLPAQEAQPLNYTWAIALALLSIPLLKQRLTLWVLLGGMVSYVGVFVISTRGDVLSFRFSDPLGVGLALFSTIIWALYWIFSTRDTRDPIVGLFLNFVFGLPFLFVVCVLFSNVQVAVQGLYGAIYVGFFEMGLTFVLWLSALKRTDSTARIGNLIFLSPFLSLVFIHFILGEHIYSSTFVGLLLIIAGLIVQQRKSRVV
ncbi:MAG: DMT family transporter [Candidatus Latescibacteria bacterium]|nr:DMT family transporter [Candidatus Latescibacterota bacterium]